MTPDLSDTTATERRALNESYAHLSKEELILLLTERTNDFRDALALQRDMLEALTALVSEVDALILSEYKPGSATVVLNDQARAAIAHAKGDQP